MTTRSPLLPSQPSEPIAPPEPEQDTGLLEAGATEPILESFALLDHRTRSRAVTRRLARKGHYVVFGDNGIERLVPLDATVTHIGRGLASDLRIEEHRVSRSHAIVVCHGHRTRLLDNRSANGTFVNGRRIIATNIENGDLIRVGAVVMTYIQMP
jgi:FHA domain